MYATDKDMAHLEALYEGRRAFHGELHDHAASGGTSDGKRPLSHWLGAMEALEMDFAAILDHKQVRHMYLPEWKDGTFIGGTEPGAGLSDTDCEVPKLHYNMLFPGPKATEELLHHFPEYQFEGGAEGHFIYPKFTRERFGELIDKVKSLGGFFVHPHPKQVMVSDNPLDYWFRDETGIEVIYVSADSQYTEANYPLYLDLLAAGKRVWCCAGGDEHLCASDKALTTIYAEEKKNVSYLSHLRVGDFVCGPVGIRMCVNDTRMGGKCSFAGGRLVVTVSDFHKSVKNPEHTFRLDLINDKGVVESHEFSCEQPFSIAIDTEDVAFYRTEIFDVNKNLRIALGNPIWNER
ncbi:MAG: hypothetical protein IJY16_07195 [Clostridia bacterium]|nr:hypothetical protein [Clostridia bacterium]